MFCSISFPILICKKTVLMPEQNENFWFHIPAATRRGSILPSFSSFSILSLKDVLCHLSFLFYVRLYITVENVHHPGIEFYFFNLNVYDLRSAKLLP